MTERHKIIPEVCFVFIRDGKILLGRRANTGWMDGYYCLPAGHGEDGETVAQATAREAMEEIGIEIDPKELTLVHVQHRWASDGGGHSRVGYYFVPKHDLGEPKNMEPDKCDDLQFFPLSNLPKNMVEPFREAVLCITRGEPYSEFGWTRR